MFNRRRIKELECQVASLEAGYQEQKKRYWQMKHSHDRLLAHFGLIEQEIPPRTIFTTKCGPEQGE